MAKQSLNNQIWQMHCEGKTLAEIANEVGKTKKYVSSKLSIMRKARTAKKTNKLVGDYRLIIRRQLSEDGNHINLSLTANKKLIDLLSFFSVKDEREVVCSYDVISDQKRHKIKSVVVRSQEYHRPYEVFFTTSFLSSGTINLAFDSLVSLNNFTGYLQRFSEFLKILSELKENDKKETIINISVLSRGDGDE